MSGVTFHLREGGRRQRGHRIIQRSRASDDGDFGFGVVKLPMPMEGRVGASEQSKESIHPLLRMRVMRLREGKRRRKKRTVGAANKDTTQLHIGYTSGAKWFPCAFKMVPRHFVPKANDKKPNISNRL